MTFALLPLPLLLLPLLLEQVDRWWLKELMTVMNVRLSLFLGSLPPGHVYHYVIRASAAAEQVVRVVVTSFLSPQSLRSRSPHRYLSIVCEFPHFDLCCPSGWQLVKLKRPPDDSFNFLLQIHSTEESSPGHWCVAQQGRPV